MTHRGRGAHTHWFFSPCNDFFSLSPTLVFGAVGFPQGKFIFFLLNVSSNMQIASTVFSQMQ